ncbi:hypothetical protein D6764_03085 [Candidatus Woesearchaeota archaeon]|nr:MAG: hypothetical protein D6764_03085 [Candidatus Woesearchaeota archaeon]
MFSFHNKDVKMRNPMLALSLALGILALLILQGCGPSRTVVVDITNDLVCKGEFLTNVSSECLSEKGCDDMCMNKGCSAYDMLFVSSEFSNSTCKCICVAENNLKKVARYYNEEGDRNE